MSINERVIPFKGLHRARCFNPASHPSIISKSFCLNCAETSYVYQHYLYRGQVRGAEKTLSLSSACPISRLLKDCKELHNSQRSPSCHIVRCLCRTSSGGRTRGARSSSAAIPPTDARRRIFSPKGAKPYLVRLRRYALEEGERL